MHITIVLFDGVDLLDVGGPYEVFLTASRLASKRGTKPPFTVSTVTTDGLAVTSFGGMKLSPHASAAESEQTPSVLLVPGTIDLDGPLNDAALLTSITELAAGADIVASICTGAFLLAEVGLLKDRPWTTHWEDIDALATRSDSLLGQRGVRWVDDGSVVTSAGLSSGIAMSLHLVDRLAGRELAVQTANQIEYDWTPGDPSCLDWSGA